MKGNDRAKTQWFLLYILKSWSEIIDRKTLGAPFTILD